MALVLYAVLGEGYVVEIFYLCIRDKKYKPFKIIVMDNDATRILNQQKSSELQKEQAAAPKAEKKETGFATRAAATAAGAAVGTSAAMAASRLYDASAENAEEVENEENAQEGVAEEANENAGVEQVQATVTQQPQHNVEEHVVTEMVESPETPEIPETEPVPADGTYVDNDAPEAIPASNEVSDDEVHVVGVAIQDNGHGGMATLAGIESGDDAVIVVDIESDGRLDYAIHDDNGNGLVDEGEIHDISAQNLSTVEVVAAHVEESHAHGEVATVVNADTGEQLQIVETEDGYDLASMEAPGSDDCLNMASNDDMADYVNDADAGMMDV